MCAANSKAGYCTHPIREFETVLDGVANRLSTFFVLNRQNESPRFNINISWFADSDTGVFYTDIMEVLDRDKRHVA